MGGKFGVLSIESGNFLSWFDTMDEAAAYAKQLRDLNPDMPGEAVGIAEFDENGALRPEGTTRAALLSERAAYRDLLTRLVEVLRARHTLRDAALAGTAQAALDHFAAPE